ncbi:MAG: hypothetical protein Q7S71_00820 [Candidatus Nitrotoga sp.]|nr:hypothetical protein [Candidatus Nitrotoga sp.]
MNLMFWKKTTGAGEEAEDELEDTAANTKPGVAAWMKLRLAALTSHFKKTPAFSAEEDQAPEASEGSKKPVDAAAKEPGLESPDMEVPAKPGLVVRAKLRLIALTRRFKKTPVSDVAEGDEEDAPEINPARSKKRLVIGGAIGLLVLLLAGIGIAIRPVAPPPQEQPDTGRGVATIASRPGEPAPAPGQPQTSTPEKPPTEIEALKKENAELHARIEALKKELPQQQPSVPAARHAGGNAPSSSASGEMMIGNKDPKDTAMTLKEAIEAMNASSGDHAKKPAK